MGRPKKQADNIGIVKAMEGKIPTLIPVDDKSLRGHESNVVRSGLTDYVCWLVFCGHSNVVISQKTGMGTDSIDRYIKSPHFAYIYERKKEAFIGLIEEESRTAILECVLLGIQKKKELLLSPRTNPGLVDKIATDFMIMGEKLLRMGSRGISSELQAIFEQTMTTRNKNGSETTTTARIIGPAEEVAKEVRRNQATNDAATGSEGVELASVEGEGSGSDGVIEVEAVPLAPWDKQGDSGSGVQRSTERTGDTDLGTPSSNLRTGTE